MHLKRSNGHKRMCYLNNVTQDGKMRLKLAKPLRRVYDQALSPHASTENHWNTSWLKDTEIKNGISSSQIMNKISWWG